MNRPERLNAFNLRMMEEMIDALDRADRDDQVRAIIVTGAGRGFCSGADLSGGPESFDPESADNWYAGQAVNEREAGERDEAIRDGGGRLVLRIFECLKPLIAAVNGPAVGAGATIQLPMDVRLASEKARFGFVFARRGLVPDAASSWFLPRVVGISRALEWTMTGRVFPAAEALAAGLVRTVYKAEDLLPAARALAREIADNTSQVSVALSRQMLWRMLGADHPMEAHRVDSHLLHERGASPDAREGIVSFLEKRPPKFSDRTSTGMPSFFPWWPARRYGS